MAANGKEYALPPTVSLALSHDRVSFLLHEDVSKFEGAEVKELLVDLLEDRAKVRRRLEQQHSRSVESAHHAASDAKECEILLRFINGEQVEALAGEEERQ